MPFPGDNFVTVAMRHVNDPLPSLLEKRPELPLRLVAAVERALEKDPAKRFPTMTEFVEELEACREQLTSGGEDRRRRSSEALSSTEDQTVIRRRSRSRAAAPSGHSSSFSPGWRFGAVAAGLFLFGDVNISGKPTLRGPIKLRAVAIYDPPPGDGTEHDDMIGNATDGNLDDLLGDRGVRRPARAKPGVGIVFDAGRSVSPKDDHGACVGDAT